MIVLGLTGGIAMGKSTVAAMFRAQGAAVSSADAIAHRLMLRRGAAHGLVKARFPEAVRDGIIDRSALAGIVFRDPERLKELEAILHPLVVVEEQRYITYARRRGCGIVVLEIPLLFETGAEKRCDVTAAVTAPPFLQRMRAQARQGMNAERLRRILARQLPDFLRRRRADYVIPTGLGKGYSMRRVKQIMEALRHAA